MQRTHHSRDIQRPVRTALGIASLALGVALAASGAAQETPSGQAQIEQVIVSASRSPESGLELALPWSQVDSDAIAVTGAVHVNQLMQRAAGAWISRGNGQESLPALRSQVFTGSGGCGAIYMGWDGIALRAPAFCNLNQLFDANTEQAGAVEVLRGPGTTVYGANALHGVINVLTPYLDEGPALRLAAEAGPYDYRRLRLALRHADGNQRVGVFFNGTDDGGYKRDSGFEQQKLTLKHEYLGDSWEVTNALEATNLNQETSGFVAGFRAYEDPALRRFNPNPEAYRDSFAVRGYSRWRRSLDGGSALQVTPYLRHTDMEFLQHFVPWQPVEKNGQTGGGLQVDLSRAGERFDWRAGMEADLTRGWLSEVQAEPFAPTLPAGVHYDYEVDALSAAVFGEARYRPTPRLQVFGGLRVEHNGYDYDNLTGDGSACAAGVTGCRFFRPADRSDDFLNGSVNLGASYQWLTHSRAYLRAARGFRPPQAAELYRLQGGQTLADLDSEQIDSLDAGLRGSVGALRYDLALFTMRKDDVIFQDADRRNVSGARTEHAGVEFSLRWEHDAGWYAGLDGTLARHRYDSSANLLGSSLDIAGNDIDTAPRHYGSARVGRELSLPSIGRLTAELEWVHLGEYFVDPDNLHRYEGHELLNLRSSLQVTAGVSATLRITNLLNEEYAERADFGFGQYRYFVGEPRGVFLELAWQR